jgi:hypothetical protein
MDTFYVGVLASIKPLNTFYKQTDSKLYELKILGNFVAALTAV